MVPHQVEELAWMRYDSVGAAVTVMAGLVPKGSASGGTAPAAGGLGHVDGGAGLRLRIGRREEGGREDLLEHRVALDGGHEGVVRRGAQDEDGGPGVDEGVD